MVLQNLSSHEKHPIANFANVSFIVLNLLIYKWLRFIFLNHYFCLYKFPGLVQTDFASPIAAKVATVRSFSFIFFWLQLWAANAMSIILMFRWTSYFKYFVINVKLMNRGADTQLMSLLLLLASVAPIPVDPVAPTWCRISPFLRGAC